jgi:hypothetical protein
MRICPGCSRSVKEQTKVVQDRKTGKRWLITYCESCHFNFDLAPAEGEVSQKEIAVIMEQPGIPLWNHTEFI